jgi:hypothetical protein
MLVATLLIMGFSAWVTAYYTAKEGWRGLGKG